MRYKKFSGLHGKIFRKNFSKNNSYEDIFSIKRKNNGDHLTCYLNSWMRFIVTVLHELVMLGFMSKDFDSDQ